MDDQKQDERLDGAIKKTKASTRKRTPSTVEFLGMKVKRQDIQEELNGMSAHEKMETLHEDRKAQLVETLETLRKEERLEDGAALFKEYRESLDPDHESDQDYYEPWWWSSRHLKVLYRRRCETKFWKEQ